MRTPPPGSRVLFKTSKAGAPAVHPWGKAAVRVWSEKKGKPSDTPVRAASRAVSKELYPEGKALARIRYFEVQRGLTPAVLPGVHLARSKAKIARPAKRSVRSPYAAAFAAKSRMQLQFGASASLPVWRERGPTLIPHGQTYGKGPNSQPSVSGRCVGVDVDPTNAAHIVVCSAGGGLWGSTDSGATWRPLTDAQPALAMGALARAPSSPNIVYAATGEGDGQTPLGGGLLRSSDGGQTWTYVAAAVLANEGIYDILVHPTDPMHLWIGGTLGMYESKNGGTTVNRVRSEQTWDLSVNVADPSELFSGCTAGLLHSTNGGSSWTTVALSGLPSGATFDRIEVCHAPSNPAVVYIAASVAGTAMLWRRSTAASGFKAEAVPAKMDTSQAWYDWCLAVAPNDANIVFWGAIELYRGKRTGSRFGWTNISSRTTGDSVHPDQHHLAFDPSNAATLYVCNDGGLFRSRDAGNHWESLNPGLGITEFEFLALLENDAAWLIGGTQDNGTLGNAGGSRWDQIALGDGGDCGAADGASPLCFHSYYGMWIERAPAKGPNAFKWQDVSPPAPKDYPALFYPPMDVAGKLLCKAGKTVFVSSDSGGSWTEIALPTSSAAQPDIASAVTIVAAGAILIGTVRGKVYRLSVGSGGWSNARVQLLASPRTGFISDLVYDGSSALWASCSVVSGAHVFRSTDGGQTWTDRSSNLPTIPINALVIDPTDANTLYAAADHGVYKTADAGASWSDFSNGLPNVIVSDMIMHQTQRLLRAGTRSRGTWEVAI
jgi:photosystem II stability/assembly factor-like uncharacterized protein